MTPHWIEDTPLEVTSSSGLAVVRESKANADDALGAVRYVQYAYPGEPLFVLRARDALTVPTLRHYQTLCNQFALWAQSDRARLHAERFVNWQAGYAKLTHLPDPLPSA